MSIFQRIRTPFSETAEEQDIPAPRRSTAVGELLRARREQLELDLDYIGEALRIRPSYLAALEQGRIEELPGPAYAMGFVRAYANYLGLDGDRVLARYKADTADVRTRPDLALPVPLGERSLPGGPILLVALILALCGYGTWYYLSTDERARPERVAAVPADLRNPAMTTPTAPVSQPATKPATTPAPDAEAAKPGAAPGSPPEQRAAAEPAPADITAPSLAAKPTITVTAPPLSTTRPGAAAPPEPIVFPGSPPSPQGAAAAQPGSPPPPGASASATATPAGGAKPDLPLPAATAPAGAPGADGRVAIRALADCWIQVRAGDQSVVFSRVLKAGETYHVPARSGLSMRTGNAGALSIEVDGKPAPSLGPIGTLRRNVALDPDALAAGTAVHG